MSRKSNKYKQHSKKPVPPSQPEVPGVTQKEKELHQKNILPVRRVNPNLQVNDEIVLNTRCRLIEVGPEMSTVEFTELYQQGRLPRPFCMHVPNCEIKSSALPKEKLPPEVPQ